MQCTHILNLVLFARLSHANIVLKWLNVLSKLLHHPIAVVVVMLGQGRLAALKARAAIWAHKPSPCAAVLMGGDCTIFTNAPSLTEVVSLCHTTWCSRLAPTGPARRSMPVGCPHE